MKKLLFALLGCCFALKAPAAPTHEARWRALAMLESGNNDRLVGTKGEVTAYQIMPFQWHRYSAKGAVAWDRDEAGSVAVLVWAGNYNSVKGLTSRPMTNKLWALVWHCPGRIDHPTSSDLDYAERFDNLVKHYE
jgi:hypothetical protein